MNKFSKVKKYFESGFWNLHRVENSVKKGWISADEFYEITGVIYDS